MDNQLIKDFFTPEEVSQLATIFSNSLELRLFENNEDCTYVNIDSVVEQKHLGRVVIKTQSGTAEYSSIHIPESIFKKVDEYVAKVSPYDLPLQRVGATLVQYDPKYGEPQLSPHVDLGSCAVIADYQLEANTSWPIGIGSQVFDMENNSMLAIDTLRQYHWRTIKKFNDGEYVRAIFFEYANDNYSSVSDDDKREEANDARQKYQSANI